jgi:hypothetical protein
MALSRNGKPALLISPNSVLANALLRSVDLLRPRVLATRPTRIEFVVGTQINGAPHLGTNLVQTAAFLLAKIARREFSIDTWCGSVPWTTPRTTSCSTRKRTGPSNRPTMATPTGAALTPLFISKMTPYGDIQLDTSRKAVKLGGCGDRQGSAGVRMSTLTVAL